MRYKLTKYRLGAGFAWGIWDTIKQVEVTRFPSAETRAKYGHKAISRHEEEDTMFMQPEITNKTRWIEIDGPQGVVVYPANDFTLEDAIEQYPGRVWAVEQVEGYGVRLSASGYLDCTDWSVFATEAEAREAARSMAEECDE